MMDKADYFKSMYDYIENLDPDIKTEDSLYEKRLATCKECEQLADGMCRGALHERAKLNGCLKVKNLESILTFKILML